MVQTKDPDKLIINISTRLKTWKNQPSIQIHDNSAKGFDVVKKMKKSFSSPNYMKPTSCSEARKEQKHVAKKPSFTPPMSSNQSATKYSTKTCSSTLKDSKFPHFLDLSPGSTESQGASVEKVCPYNSCSLNGHKHESNPPLKSFLSARRRSPCKEDIGADFSGKEVSDVGNYDWENTTSMASLAELFGEGSDAELEEGKLYLMGDVVSETSDEESDTSCVNPSGDEILCLLDEEGVKKDDIGIEFLAGDSDELSREEIKDFHVQFSDSESSINDVYEEETELDQFLKEELSGVDKKTIEASKIGDEMIKESPKSDDQTTLTEKMSEESLINEVAREVFSNELRAMEVLGSCQDDPLSFLGDSKALGKGKTLRVSEEGNFNHEESSFSIRSRKRGEKSEELKPFNPRGPNYLEEEPEAERERVDLRHQEMDDRRKAEEWMTDYALRRTVNQLDTARKRRVALLVEAFETIAPPTRIRDARVRPISYGP